MDKSAAGEGEGSKWLSTYGLITVEKILDRYGIRLSQEDLLHASQHSDCVFLRFIQVPLKNIFNGLILQQAKDYQTYAQKQYIDYLLSGESSQEGSQACEDLEETRRRLVSLGEAFQEEEHANEKMIARSQALLIKTTRQWNQRVLKAAKKIQQAFGRTGFMANNEQMFVKCLYALLCGYEKDTVLPDEHAVWSQIDRLLGQTFDLSLRQILREEVSQLAQIDVEAENELEAFRDEVRNMGESLKNFRSDFSFIIVKTNELLTMVNGYRLDADKVAVNQQDLHFDAKIGEDVKE